MERLLLFWKGERLSDSSSVLRVGGNRDGQNNHLVGLKTVMDFLLQTLKVEVLIFLWAVVRMICISMFTDAFLRSLWFR